MLDSYVIDTTNARDLSPEVLASPGRPRILPSSFYRNTTAAERIMLCVRNGLYSLPTDELVDWLRAEIAGRSAIEIGAGHGALAAALGIPATDSWLQLNPAVAAHYAERSQPTVTYGRNVERLDAAAAIVKHKPKVVVACWVTHKYQSWRPEAAGNEFGVDEEALIDACETYILVGNAKVHEGKSIWNRKHRIIEPYWLYSRTMNDTKDFIAVWGK